jgi:hypothetical protein
MYLHYYSPFVRRALTLTNAGFRSTRVNGDHCENTNLAHFTARTAATMTTVMTNENMTAALLAREAI